MKTLQYLKSSKAHCASNKKKRIEIIKNLVLLLPKDFAVEDILSKYIEINGNKPPHHLGMSCEKIQDVLNELGIKFKATFNEDLLYNLYVVKKKSIVFIMRTLKISYARLIKTLKGLNIHIRSLAEAGLLRERPKRFFPKEEIMDLYVNEKMAPANIGKKFGCDARYIIKILKEGNIKIRNRSEATSIAMKNRKRSADSILKTAIGVKKWRQNHPDVISGPYNGMYIDGKTGKDYCNRFIGSLKRKIKNRDNHKCVLCGRTELDAKLICYNKNKKNIKGLFVHHIDYDKKNNEEENLITLCSSCHPKTNVPENRDAWTTVFQMIQEGR